MYAFAVGTKNLYHFNKFIICNMFWFPTQSQKATPKALFNTSALTHYTCMCIALAFNYVQRYTSESGLTMHKPFIQYPFDAMSTKLFDILSIYHTICQS